VITSLLGKFELKKKNFEKYCKNLITMLCPCHATALVANAACTAIPEAREELVRKVTSLISNSPKCACFNFSAVSKIV